MNGSENMNFMHHQLNKYIYNYIYIIRIYPGRCSNNEELSTVFVLWNWQQMGGRFHQSFLYRTYTCHFFQNFKLRFPTVIICVSTVSKIENLIFPLFIWIRVATHIGTRNLCLPMNNSFFFFSVAY